MPDAMTKAALLQPILATSCIAIEGATVPAKMALGVWRRFAAPAAWHSMFCANFAIGSRM